jgi:hypothetical protein
MPDLKDPKTKSAIDELSEMILESFPGTKMHAEIRDDPLGVYLISEVDLDDPDEVMDLVVDRVVELNVWEGVPIHVIPLRNEERDRALRAELAKGLPPKPLYD